MVVASQDEVVDIELRVVAGILFCTFSPDACPDGDIYNVEPNNLLGGGVHGNDVSFLDVLPVPGASRIRASSTGTTPSRPRPARTVARALAPVGAMTPAPPEAEAGVNVDLDELNDSGVSGTATLKAVGDSQTEVTDQGRKVRRATTLSTSTLVPCDDLNPNPLFPLTDVDANGDSVTTVDVGLGRTHRRRFRDQPPQVATGNRHLHGLRQHLAMEPLAASH